MTRRDPLIIALAGAAGAGKDTAAKYLHEVHAFETYALAAPIRSMLSSLLIDAGIDCECLYQREAKEAIIPGIGISPRALMQTLGTEWGRALRADMWTNLADRQLGLLAGEGPFSAPIHDRLVITDVRFPDEADWARSRGGFVVRIVGRGGIESSHASERHGDDLAPWGEIDNSGGLEHLHEQLDALIAHIAAMRAEELAA